MAGLGEEPLAELGALDLGDVLDHVDREPHRAALVEHRRRLHARPPVLGAAVVAVADGERRRALAEQRAPAGQALDGKLGAVLGEHLVAPPDLQRVRRQQLLRVAEAQQPHGGVVGVDQAAVGALRGDGVRHALDDRLEIVARAPRFGVQPRVVDRRRAAVGQVLRPGHVLAGVAAPGGAVGQREVADHRAAHAHRDHERRGDADLLDEPVLLGILGDRRPERVRDLAHELRLAGPDHLRRAHLRVGVERVAAVVLLDERALGRIRVLHHDALDLPVGPQQLDEAPVGVGGDGEPRDGRQRLAVVERVEGRGLSHGLDSMPGLRPRTRAGSPRTAGGGPPRRAGSRSPCPASPSRGRR